MKIVKAKTIKGGLMGFGVLFGLIVAGQVAYPQIARAEASTQSVFIPAYTYPKTWQGGDNSYWNAITAAGGQKAPFVVVNPNSGSGDKVDQNYQKQIKNLEEAKINYIGYVKHGGQTRPVKEAAAEIDAWYKMYPGIKGMFFDETANHNDADKTCYIANISNYIKVKHPGAIVVHNPGTRMYDDNILPYGDVFMTVEAMANDYINDPYYSANHQDARAFEKNPNNAHKIWHVVYDITSADQQAKVLQLSRERNAGWVFATTDQFANNTANPYDNLSRYFNEYVNTISSRPQTTLKVSGPTPLPAGCNDEFGLNVTETSHEQPVEDNKEAEEPKQDSGSNETPKPSETTTRTTQSPWLEFLRRLFGLFRR